MSLLSRIANVFRPDRLSTEIDEELRSHLDEALRDGREPSEARRAFGSPLRQREASQDIRLIPWLDSLRADAIFGWRQLSKNKVTSAAAILSLALAIGSCTSAFRLIDALLLRPLPVVNPERLYALAREGTGFDGRPQTFDGWAYPSFARMRDAAKGQAELLAISYSERTDLTYKSDRDMEKANLQYVSGAMFGSFGLKPALGRLLTDNDDLKPNAHPYAVLSWDYWSRRFARDPGVVGRTFNMGERVYEIVGVGPEPFTGTETGTVTDIFLPTMMEPRVIRDDSTWHRTLAAVNPGVPLEPLRAKLHVTSRAFEEDRAKHFTGMTRKSIDRFLDQKVVLEPAAAGVSGIQQVYRQSLVALAVLVALVLLIACANIANLMTAQAAARAREMALRVSIGAGRWRLVQLVLMESAILALLSATIGGVFAWWSAPFVVGMINPPDNPARLFLPADWRVFGFGLALTLGVMFLFGLAPALRASVVKPALALKGGADPHSRRRMMHGLIAAQVAFCFLVLFVAGLFVATFDRLSNRPTGFSSDKVVLLETVSRSPQAPVYWEQLAAQLNATPGVAKVALAGMALLGNNSWNGFVSIDGAPPGPVLAYFLAVSPGWVETMKASLIGGRDFRPNDISAQGSGTGAAIVNETFAKTYFNGRNPIGRFYARGANRFQIVGLFHDTPYRSMREPILPVALVPFQAQGAGGAPQPVRSATFVVRTLASNPLALANTLRRAVPGLSPDFRVSNVRTQAELVRAQTIRERLLATLSLFFAVVALFLAGVGLYGVLNYSVLQRRREIGIRMAIGARPGGIVRLVTVHAFTMVLAGAASGVGLGMLSVRYIQSLFYEVSPSDARMLAIPCVSLLTAALLAALPAVIRAVRIDPAKTLRSE